jgi:hypothetical protein
MARTIASCNFRRKPGRAFAQCPIDLAELVEAGTDHRQQCCV